MEIFAVNAILRARSSEPLAKLSGAYACCRSPGRIGNPTCLPLPRTPYPRDLKNGPLDLAAARMRAPTPAARLKLITSDWCEYVWRCLCSAAMLGCPRTPRPLRVNLAEAAAVRPGSDCVNLESRVRTNRPQGSRSAPLQLLRDYFANAPEPPLDDPQRRLARLDHILYLIDHFPDAPILATPVAYIAARRGIYANSDDHQVGRTHWFSALDSQPRNVAVIVNAVRFLAVEQTKPKRRMFSKTASLPMPNNQWPRGEPWVSICTDGRSSKGWISLRVGARPSAADPELAAHARSELERTSNAFVLSPGAGTAIFNLAGKADSRNCQPIRRCSTLLRPLSTRSASACARQIPRFKDQCR